MDQFNFDLDEPILADDVVSLTESELLFEPDEEFEECPRVPPTLRYVPNYDQPHQDEECITISSDHEARELTPEPPIIIQKTVHGNNYHTCHYRSVLRAEDGSREQRLWVSQFVMDINWSQERTVATQKITGREKVSGIGIRSIEDCTASPEHPTQIPTKGDEQRAASIDRSETPGTTFRKIPKWEWPREVQHRIREAQKRGKPTIRFMVSEGRYPYSVRAFPKNATVRRRLTPTGWKPKTG